MVPDAFVKIRNASIGTEILSRARIAGLSDQQSFVNYGLNASVGTEIISAERI
jgi:hypothetical protein